MPSARVMGVGGHAVRVRGGSERSRRFPGARPEAHRQRLADALLAALDPGTLPGRTCMGAKEPHRDRQATVDGGHRRSRSPCSASLATPTGRGIRGVIGRLVPVRALTVPGRPTGCYATIDGIPHFLSRAAAEHLLELSAQFDLVWASGWEEKAEEYLPRLLGVPGGPAVPALRARTGRGPLAATGTGSSRRSTTYAGARPLAWIDDAFNDACHAWAAHARSPHAARPDRARARPHAGAGPAAERLGAEPRPTRARSL